MATLERVTGQREWESKYGTMVSVKLDFGDFQAELNTKPETLSSRLEMCEAWIGKDSSEWAFEDRGTWDNGDPKPKKVSSYPGKAVPGHPGGSYGPNTRSRDREAEQPSILASVALKAAVERCNSLGIVLDGVEPRLDHTVLDLASSYYAFLQETSKRQASGSAPASVTAPADPLLSADPGLPSAAEAHSGPSAGPSTSTAAEDSDPGVSLLSTGSEEQGEGASFGEGEQTPSSCHHTYRTDPNALGVRVCVKCGDKRRRSA